MKELLRLFFVIFPVIDNGTKSDTIGVSYGLIFRSIEMLNAKDFYVWDEVIACLRGDRGVEIDGLSVNRFGASISMEAIPNIFDNGFCSRYRARKVLKAMVAEGVVRRRNNRFYLVEKS